MMNKILSFINNSARSITNSATLKNTGVVFILRVSGALLIFIFNWIIVKLLGLEDSGVFFLAFTLLNVFSIVALYGVDQLMLRKISSTNEDGLVNNFYLNGFRFVLIGSVLSGISLFLLSNFLGDFFNSNSLASVLRVISFTIPLMSLSTYLGMVVRAKKKYAESAYILTNSYYMTSIIVFSVLLILGGATLIEVTYSFLIAMILGFIINFFISSKTYDKLLHIERSGNQSFISIKKIFKESNHLFVTSVIILGFGALNVLMVGFFLSDSDVSIFAVSEKIAKLLTFSLFAINIVLSPVVSQLYAKNRIEKLNIEVQKATLISIVFAVPLYLLFIIFPGFILGLFGADYIAGSNTFIILSTGQLINALTGAVFITMIMTGLEKVVNVVSLCTLIFVLLLGAFLIPRYELIGAAVTAAVGYSVLNILLAYFLIKYRKINIYPSIHLLKGLLGDAKSGTN